MFNRTLHRVGAATAAVAVMIAGTGAAHAAEAHAKTVKPFVNNHIVAQKSIGGFVLGEAPSNVRKHFPKKDRHAGYCQYTGSGYLVTVQFGAKPNSRKATVDFVSLAPTKGKDGAKKVHTSSGVRLGSSYAHAKKGLKHFKYVGTKESGYFYRSSGNGGVGSTVTTFSIDKGVVDLINIQRIDHVG